MVSVGSAAWSLCEAMLKTPFGSFQVGVHDVDKLLGGPRLRGGRALVGVQHVEADVPLPRTSAISPLMAPRHAAMT